MKVVTQDGALKVTSTFESGWTPTRIIFADSTGRLSENAGLTYDSVTDILSVDQEIRVVDGASRLMTINATTIAGFGTLWGAVTPSSSNYVVAQGALEDTFVNAGTGRTLAFAVGGTQQAGFTSGALTFIEGVNLVTGTTTGTKFGTAASQKLGFWGATPVVQPSAWTQTYSTTSKTVSVFASSPVSTTGATSITPFGYTTAAQANDIVTQINNCRSDIAVVKNNLNSLIDDFQAMGLAS